MIANIIDVTGSNKSRRSLAENIVNFCIEELMPRMKTLTIDVNIHSMKGEDAIGFCWETSSDKTWSKTSLEVSFGIVRVISSNFYSRL